jgi:hypothetical protein
MIFMVRSKQAVGVFLRHSLVQQVLMGLMVMTEKRVLKAHKDQWARQDPQDPKARQGRKDLRVNKVLKATKVLQVKPRVSLGLKDRKVRREIRVTLAPQDHKARKVTLAPRAQQGHRARLALRVL